MALLANALPEGTGDGYVAAAYIVFFVLLLVYVAIMALRLSHVQRDLRELQARAEPAPREAQGHSEQGLSTAAQTSQPDTAGAITAPPAEHEQDWEREPA